MKKATNHINLPNEITHPTICPYCGGKVSLVKTSKYPSGYMYSCDNCHAQVGTYKKEPTLAMGTLADSETRKKRLEVHKLLDRFWRSNLGRGKAYTKLANELGIEKEQCHIALMDLQTLNKAEQIILKWWREKYDK